ncbi:MULTISPECIES: hypothetical protein [unclassified Oceanispirochaeta]|uniref:hypothetical protein n=1 Tax=unclassified Oceanispirochaeta TaxID=2635722 RepID=UPI000E097BF0|nr:MULTISPECIES: hypothetical protein [unclassified Oceanispirochaeta]MBF9018964.1 hypothetical protein [Oceanispirochaeta sp. M2]NPD75444.1 hypothetical protein [Oceanispirochaeta sp. M1]RDG28694.1 hypothetical protein DV872_25455 [Oceanispirochaeta sp. M1]
MLVNKFNLRLRDETVKKLDLLAETCSDVSGKNVSMAILVRKAIYDMLLNYQKGYGDPKDTFRYDLEHFAYDYVRSLDTMFIRNYTDAESYVSTEAAMAALNDEIKLKEHLSLGFGEDYKEE